MLPVTLQDHFLRNISSSSSLQFSRSSSLSLSSHFRGEADHVDVVPVIVIVTDIDVGDVVIVVVIVIVVVVVIVAVNVVHEAGSDGDGAHHEVHESERADPTRRRRWAVNFFFAGPPLFGLLINDKISSLNSILEVFLLVVLYFLDKLFDGKNVGETIYFIIV